MLYSPITFRDLTLSNRWMMSPMCMFSAHQGFADDFHFVHYGSRAQGGCGLLMLEATSITPNGRISPEDLGIWNDSQAYQLSKICHFIHNHSQSKIGIQLAHAGRKSSTRQGKQLSVSQGGWQPIAPSPIPFRKEEVTPHEATLQELEALPLLYQQAAKRAIQAGFDLIEIHAAHGYLFHQFLSPLSNLRSDRYGGSFANRSRLLLEVVEAVQQVLDSKHPLFVRLSATDYVQGGWDLEQSVQLSHQLKEAGVDLVDVSSGGLVPDALIPSQPLYQVPFAQEIRQKAEIPTAAVGLITNAEQAQKVLDAQQADLIAVGRELLRNPYLPLTESLRRNEPCHYPLQYRRAFTPS